jgi:hypothetical protein
MDISEQVLPTTGRVKSKKGKEYNTLEIVKVKITAKKVDVLYRLERK